MPRCDQRWWLLSVAVTVFACGAPPTDDAGVSDAAVALDDGGQADAAVQTDGGTVDGGRLPDGGRPDGGTRDGGDFDASVVDGGDDAGALTVTYETVSGDRELRGVWVASVINLDWPQATGASADAGKASLEALVDSLCDAGLNAIFFQVRPESDALYASSLEPWSRYLSGQQGRDPGWDPLEWLLQVAHARGLEVHAWVNPYRALVSSSSSATSTHVSKTLSAYARPYNNAVVMDPGAVPVRRHLGLVIDDLLTHYDVDGLHFDDYFYPYPDASQTPFPDDATYDAYLSGGGTMTRANWRRDNVNALIRETMELVTLKHPTVRFGVSPFGIWKSNVPVPGLSAYDAVYCDAPTWMANGWVDYLAPQLYWRENSPQDYSTLASWWAARNVGGRHLFPGHAVHQLEGANWPVSEIELQVELTRQLKAQGALGDIHFRSAFIASDTKGVARAFRQTLYPKPALLPPLPRTGGSSAPAAPLLTRHGSQLIATATQALSTRFLALYRFDGTRWQLDAVKGGPMASFDLTSGTFAVTAVARGGAESLGAKVTLP